MNLIQNNPYRIAGIFANATTKEIHNRKTKIKAFARVGKSISSEFDFSFLPPVNRSEESINKAFSQIEQNPDKVKNALFWFISTNSVDATAIQHLMNGNKEKAVEIWEKLTEDKEVNTKNLSAFNNLSTLLLLSPYDGEIKKGIEAKVKLLESDNFTDFVHTVADKTFVVDSKKQIELLIDELLLQFKSRYSATDTIKLFNNCNSTTQKYLAQKFTEEPVHKIEVQIEQAKKKRIEDKSNAYRFGTDLYKNTKNELILLKSILGTANLQYKMLADNVAKEILQCSIDYFNESQEQEKSSNYLEEAMKLAKLVETVAVNDATKTKVKESIKTLEEMKDRELSQAIEVLKSVKSAYETNKAKITAEVKMQEMTLSFGQSINWSKVDKMIENSVAWDKVIELINDTIPPRNVEKIKNSDKQTKVREYKSLVDFLLGKLNYSQKSQVKYLCYWKTINTAPPVSSKPTSTYKSPSTTSSNNNEKSWAEQNPGCLIAIIIAVIIFLINVMK